MSKTTIKIGDRVRVNTPSKRYYRLNGHCGYVKELMWYGRKEVCLIRFDDGDAIKLPTNMVSLIVM